MPAKLVKPVRLNDVKVSGYVGNEPKMGTSWASFSLALQENWKDKQTDEWKSRTTWMQVSCFGKTADAVGAGVHKGTFVVVFGRLSSYQTKDDDKQVVTISANQVQILTDESAAQQPKPERQENPPEPGDGDQLNDIPW